MKKLLITGASGFLGWNACWRAKRDWLVSGALFSHPTAIDGCNVMQLDLTDFAALKGVFQTIKPTAVIHTAAIADANFCQSHPAESRKMNVDAAINIAGLCADAAIPLVFTSTDLVFDGLNAPYREEDPVCPGSVYGEQKAAAERGVLLRYSRAVVCRMALMFGVPGPASKSFVQPMLSAIREGREIPLFTDEFRTPLSVESAVSGLFLALEKAHGVLHLGGAERISRYEFVRLLVDTLGIKNARLKPCTQKDMVMSAPRPPDVSLNISKAQAIGFNPAPLREEIEAIVW